MTQHPLARHVASAAAAIESNIKSNGHWHPVRDLVAEALRLGEGAVYAATVNKPGNLTVRMNQSDDAIDAEVFVAMYTGDRGDVEKVVASAVKKARKQGRDLVLIFADQGAGMELVAGVKVTGAPVPSVLQAAFPAAVWANC